jgi:hypothetical protein
MPPSPPKKSGETSARSPHTIYRDAEPNSSQNGVPSRRVVTKP